MQDGEARKLIRRCASKRDVDTWAEFQDRFHRPLRSGVRRTLARFGARVSEDDHQDLIQETYFRLLEGEGRRLRSCRGEVEGAIAVYLGKVAESVVIDFLRGRSAAKRGAGLLVEPRSDQVSSLVENVVDPRRTPEEKLLLRERRARFLASCRRLVGKGTEKRDLLVLYLAFFEGCTSREICGRVGHGLRPSTVDSLIHRMRKRLAALGVEMPRRRPMPSRTLEAE